MNLPEELDVLIIGAGMSGLAAGIRLAHFGKKVLILERHNAPGGLNSFYSIKGRKYDVGLHALTNFAGPAAKQAPLNKLLRQLRLSRDDWDLNEQIGSSILFKTSQGEKRLAFSNDFSLFESQIAEEFPQAIDGFRCFLSLLEKNPMGALSQGPFVSTKAIMQSYIQDSLLVDMLLAPLLYYGSAYENDIDWDQACVMFQSIFKEGFARPYEGVRVIIRSLVDKYRANGGLRKMKTGVKTLEVDQKKVKGIVLDDGSRLRAKTILSSAGYLETLALCRDVPTPQVQNSHSSSTFDRPCLKEAQSFAGQLSFVETLSVVDTHPQALGLKDTIVFFNIGDSFSYEKPESLVDVRSGVICVPNNYHYSHNRQLEEGWLRITALANYTSWKELSPEAYQSQKKHYFEALQSSALEALAPGLNNQVKARTVATDMFTPLTVEKYTGHVHGAIYGSSHKVKNGRTAFENLFLCGTDQGFLGIIGAMMSGVSLANTLLAQPDTLS